MTVTITQKERDDDQNKCEKENMASSSGLWDNMSQQVMTTHVCSITPYCYVVVHIKHKPFKD